MRRQLWRAGGRGVTTGRALLVFLLAVVLGIARDQVAPAGQQDRDPSSFRLSVEVSLVVLHATVTDREGDFVHNLGAQNFEVYEDGVRQRIRLFKDEDIPVTVGLVIDHSSTMRRKLAEVSAAARTFVRSSNAADEMFVVNFNEKVYLGLPVTMRFTDSAAELEKAITRAPAGGETALYDAVARALKEMQAGNRDRRALIVISDGGDNASAHSLNQVMKLARQSSAVIYTVGIFDENDPDQNPGVLRNLAQATGGEAFLLKQASEAVSICERIARDIRDQYTIGYIPLNPPRDGTYRTIRVSARSKDHTRLSVRTRTGYFTTGSDLRPPRESGK